MLDESGIESEQDVRVEIEPVSIAVDRTRTEQIIQALLRSAGDRTPEGKTITVRLIRDKGGALIVVEDAESSAEILSVRWCGGSPRCKVAGPRSRPAKAVAPRSRSSCRPVGPAARLPSSLSKGIRRPSPSRDEPNHWVQAEQALVRELRELSQGKAK